MNFRWICLIFIHTFVVGHIGFSVTGLPRKPDDSFDYSGGKMQKKELLIESNNLKGSKSKDRHQSYSLEGNESPSYQAKPLSAPYLPKAQLSPHRPPGVFSPNLSMAKSPAHRAPRLSSSNVVNGQRPPHGPPPGFEENLRETQSSSNVLKAQRPPHSPPSAYGEDLPKAQRPPHKPPSGFDEDLQERESLPYLPKAQRPPHSPPSAYGEDLPKAQRPPHSPPSAYGENLQERESLPYLPQAQRPPHKPPSGFDEDLPKAQRPPHSPPSAYGENLQERESLPHLPKAQRPPHSPPSAYGEDLQERESLPYLPKAQSLWHRPPGMSSNVLKAQHPPHGSPQAFEENLRGTQSSSHTLKLQRPRHRPPAIQDHMLSKTTDYHDYEYPTVPGEDITSQEHDYAFDYDPRETKREQSLFGKEKTPPLKHHLNDAASDVAPAKSTPSQTTPPEPIKKITYNLEYHPSDYTQEKTSLFSNQKKTVLKTSSPQNRTNATEPDETIRNSNSGSTPSPPPTPSSEEPANTTTPRKDSDPYVISVKTNGTEDDPSSWASVTYKYNKNAFEKKGLVLGNVQLKGGYLGSLVFNYGSEWPFFSHLLETLYNQVIGTRSMATTELLKAEDLLSSYDNVADALDTTLRSLAPALKNLAPTIENLAQMIESRVLKAELERNLERLMDSVNEPNSTWPRHVILKALSIASKMSGLNKGGNS